MGLRAEDGRQRTENRGQMSEGGSGTRRRPIGPDYAAATDAEIGKRELKAIFDDCLKSLNLPNIKPAEVPPVFF
jgi:hypothetical protein